MLTLSEFRKGRKQDFSAMIISLLQFELMFFGQAFQITIDQREHRFALSIEPVEVSKPGSETLDRKSVV